MEPGLGAQHHSWSELHSFMFNYERSSGLQLQHQEIWLPFLSPHPAPYQRILLSAQFSSLEAWIGIVHPKLWGKPKPQHIEALSRSFFKWMDTEDKNWTRCYLWPSADLTTQEGMMRKREKDHSNFIALPSFTFLEDSASSQKATRLPAVNHFQEFLLSSLSPSLSRFLPLFLSSSNFIFTADKKKKKIHTYHKQFSKMCSEMITINILIVPFGLINVVFKNHK